MIDPEPPGAKVTEGTDAVTQPGENLPGLMRRMQCIPLAVDAATAVEIRPLGSKPPPEVGWMSLQLKSHDIPVKDAAFGPEATADALFAGFAVPLTKLQSAVVTAQTSVTVKMLESLPNRGVKVPVCTQSVTK